MGRERAVEIDVRDERVWALVEPHARLETVAAGFRFLEGPVWHPYERYLLFSDIIGDSMYRWSEAEGLRLFRRPSHMANGNTFDRAGRLLTCEHASSRVTRTVGDRAVEMLASHYEGRELNSPNDIIVKRDGAIYFTDPTSGRSARYGVLREQELPFQGVYRLDPVNKSLTLLVDDFSKPNGLCFSLDERHLFVNDSDRFHIRVFDVREDDTLGEGYIWADLEGEGVGVPDGMKVDQSGHLYCCGPGGIHLFTPGGTSLGVLRMPQHTANFAWGDGDLRSLFITASTTLYRLRVRVPGLATF